MALVRKAVIPAAGFGTRFLPASKALPKEMFPIVDTPTLQYIVEEAVKSGIKEILIILGRNKKAIEDHFDKSFELEYMLKKNNKLDFLKVIEDLSDLADIFYVRQKDMMGSGNALLAAETFVSNEPFAVLFGDDLIYNPANPCLKQLLTAYYKTNQCIMGVQEVPTSEAYKHGIVKPGAQKGNYTVIEGLIEKPQGKDIPSNLACLGRFVLTPDIFDAIRRTPKSPNGEVGLTDAIKLIANQVGAYAYKFEGKRYDIGDKLGYIKATVEYAMLDPKLSDSVKDYLKDLTKTF